MAAHLNDEAALVDHHGAPPGAGFASVATEDISAARTGVDPSASSKQNASTFFILIAPEHVFDRFASRGEADWGNRVLPATRHAFGGHLEKSPEE